MREDRAAPSLGAVLAGDADAVEQLWEEVVRKQNAQAGRGANGRLGKLGYAVAARVAVQVVRRQHRKAAGNTATAGPTRFASACGLNRRRAAYGSCYRSVTTGRPARTSKDCRGRWAPTKVARERSVARRW